MKSLQPRRDFLKLTGVVLLASNLPRVSGAETATSSAKKRPNVRKAIMYQTIGYKGPVTEKSKTDSTLRPSAGVNSSPVMEKFRACKEAGFEGIEAMSHMNQEEVLAARDATGLKVPSVCCNTHWNLTLSHPSESVREKGLEGLKQSLRDAKAYGATSVLLVPGVARDGVTYEQCWQRSIEQIRKAIPLAEELGVKISIENVWNDFITKETEAVRYLDEINSPYVAWHFDIGNIIYYGDPIDWIKALGKRISRLHIKEYSRDIAMKKNRGAGFGVKFLEGANNWPGIMKALDEVGYDGWGIAEQRGGDTLEGLKELSEDMDRIFSS